jgi:hypothetical protein
MTCPLRKLAIFAVPLPVLSKRRILDAIADAEKLRGFCDAIKLFLS